MNTKSGLLSLPVEVYGMIQTEMFSGSTVVTREDVLKNDPYLDARDFTYRADILRPIMHTCHALRSTYVSAYYEHVEVCMVRTGRVWYLQLSERLERTSKALMAPEMKELAAQVRYLPFLLIPTFNAKSTLSWFRVMTVCLTRCNDKVVLPLFASCLAMLPNLHTLQIMHAHSQMMTPIKVAFENKRLPQIRTIILPDCAHHLLRSCPEVRDVSCNEDGGSRLLGAIQKACRNVEVVHGFYEDMSNLSKSETFDACPQRCVDQIPVSQSSKKHCPICASSLWKSSPHMRQVTNISSD